MTKNAARQPARQELGAFLRAARQHLDPAEVGLPGGGRRRTPGLRREEVAAMAGVGLAWYTWLEQGRVDTSRQVLDAVSRALRLDADAHRHVLTLAGLRPAPGDGAEDSHDLLDRLRPLLAGWTTTPALLVDPRFDILAWNEAYRAVWPDPGLTDPDRRNLLLLLVSDPAVQERLPGWRDLAQQMFWQLRANADRCPANERTREVLAHLERERPDLAPWWRCRSVREFRGDTLAVRLPSGQQLTLACSLLRPSTADPAVSVLVQAPADEPTRRWLASLA
jgi:transcriptional regulator with XRE-family HTH domain